jgi:four helix bundle protein
LGRNYKDLHVWRKSFELVDNIYVSSKAFPKDELFGLQSQMRRAAVSIASNIAEGSARHSYPDFKRFLRMARGSLAELETQIMIACRRGYLTEQNERNLMVQTAEIDRMLAGLIASLDAHISQPQDQPTVEVE